MKEKDKIENLFQSNQHKLEGMPSEKVWRQLEQKLDQHTFPKTKRTAKIISFRTWAIAASMAGIVALGAVLAVFFSSEKSILTAQAEAAELEQLEIEDTRVRLPFLNTDYALGAVKEGQPGRKLVSVVNYFYNEKAPKSAPVSTAKKLIADTIEAMPINFDWLLGEWKGKATQGESSENWQKIDENTFTGIGYLVYLKDTLFSESMKLVRRGKDWYYVLQLDHYMNSAAYKLSYVGDEELVFTNKKVAFPKQVLLRKNGDNGFSTVFLPSGEIKISPNQLEFITKRNVMFIDKAIRNVWRI